MRGEGSLALHKPPGETFVGRHDELAVLDSLLAEAGEPRSLVIRGESGIGKTALVHEWARRAHELGTHVLFASCYEPPGGGPFFPFRQVLAQLRLSGSGPRAAASNEESPPNDPQSLMADLRAPRSRFLLRLAEGIVNEATAAGVSAICVENLQWADVSTLLLINHVLDLRREGLAVVCTVRSDEPIDEEARPLISWIEARSREIRVAGLSAAEANQLADRVLAPELHLSERELHFLAAFTRGNPMFIRELLLDLVESGVLGSLPLDEAVERAQIPHRLGAVVDRRLGRFPAHVMSALRAASVIGEVFSTSLLARVTRTATTTIDDGVQFAVRRGVLAPAADRAGTLWRITHPLLAKRLYDSLRAAERRKLHREIARAAAEGELSTVALARHRALGRSQAPDRTARELCQTAALEAEELFAYEDAARYWQMALSCTSPRALRTKAGLCRREGRALRAAGKWDRAAEAWAQAFSLFSQLGDAGSSGQVALALGEMHRWRSNLDEAVRWLRLALDMGCAERARALALLGGITILRGDQRGRTMLEEAEALIASDDAPDPAAVYWLSYGRLIDGDRSKARALAELGMHSAEQRSDLRSRALLAASLFHHELADLDLEAARRRVKAVEEAEDSADPVTMIRSLLCKALLHGYEGRWQAVVSECEQLMGRIRLASNFQVATASFFWAEAKLALGDSGAAREAMVRWLGHLAEMQPVAALHLSRALLRAGLKEEATTLAREQLPALQRDCKRPTSAAGMAVLGDVAASIGDRALCRLCYAALAKEPRAITMAYAPISVQRVRGRLAAALGDWSAAVDHFEVAIEQLSRGRALWELAQTYLDCADMRRVRRRRGDETKAQAAELQGRHVLVSLGMEHLVLPGRQQGRSMAANRFGLTGRELEVLALLAEGMRNREIARALTVSLGTVNRHVENILGKMGVTNRIEAVVLAAREGIVGPMATEARPNQVPGAIEAPASITVA